MKVNVISRDDDEHTRETTTEIERTFFNPDPNLHRFEKPREYVRALNASKFKQMFSRPFVGDLSGHRDTPHTLALSAENLHLLVSGSGDGEIRVWNIPRRCVVWRVDHGHNGFVNGIVFAPSGDRFYTCGQDKYVKVWKADLADQIDSMMNIRGNVSSTLLFGDYGSSSSRGSANEVSPLQTHSGKFGYRCIDHHYKDDIMATGGETVDIWDTVRLVPRQSTTPSRDGIVSLRFNRAEKNLMAIASRDRLLSLYDIRTDAIISKFLMKRHTNSISWNPMQPFIFSVASEDYNAYTFDMRMLDKGPTILHSGHISAVMDIDYSPTGQEFVTAGYDQTVRIFRTDSTHYQARDIYTTPRMRRVFSVRFSGDGRYIYSGSDDHAIRIWKTEADQSLRTQTKKEKLEKQYQKQLINRYEKFKEVSSVVNHKHLPKRIYNKQKQMREEIEATRRKEERFLRHTIKKSKQDKAQKKPWRLRNFLGTRE